MKEVLAPLVRSGLRLIELLLNLTVAGVVIGVGTSGLRERLPRYQAVQASKNLKADFIRLRNTAIRSNLETRLVIEPGREDGMGCESQGVLGGGWRLEVGNRSSSSTSWDVLPVDAATDGADDDQSEGVVDLAADTALGGPSLCLMQWGELMGPGQHNGDSIVFSPRGWVLNPGSDFDEGGVISLTVINQIAAADQVDDSITLLVARSGAVELVSSLSKEQATSLYESGEVGAP